MKQKLNGIKSVIFDFDYTLADSSQGLVECVNYSLKKMNLPLSSSPDIRRTIGLSLKETFTTLTGINNQALSVEFIRLFTERADQIMLDNIVIFDSVRPTTNVLLKNGLTLGIVSTKFRYRIEAFLRRENLKNIFKIIIGGEELAAHKPDPTGLNVAISKLKCTPENTIYVGDSVTDAQTANNANVRFIAVLTGVTPKQDFNKYSPCAIITDLRMLPLLIIRLDSNQ